MQEIQSVVIKNIVDISISRGNRIREISDGWAKVKQVVFMSFPLTSELRLVIERMENTRYWVAEQTPHNRAEEGFTDDICHISISFPKQ